VPTGSLVCDGVSPRDKISLVETRPDVDRRKSAGQLRLSGVGERRLPPTPGPKPPNGPSEE
jgi:hypothetical protein